MNYQELLQFEEIRFGLQGIADEAAIRFSRSCFTPVIRDYLDFSTAICDSQGRVIVQGFALPLHLGAIPAAMSTILEIFPGGLAEGDVAILNDPYRGGMHLPDIFVIVPAVVRGECVGYCVFVAHHGDIGGRVPGGSAADSTEIFQEGLRIPPVLLYSRGIPNDELAEMIRANVRLPDILWADLEAQVAGARQAADLLASVVDEHGIVGFGTAVEALLENTSQRLDRELGSWPTGVFEFEDYEDHDGIDERLIPIRVAVTIENGTATFDFTGSSPQVAGAINATRSFTKSACYAALRALCVDEIPVNHGFTQRVTVHTPQGSVVDVSFPGAVAARGVIGYRVIDAVFGALASALPDRVPAAGDGGVSGLRIGGFDDRGRRFQFNDLVCGAWGARPNADGLDGAAPMAANVANRPVEIIEREDPVRVLAYRFVPDTEGSGRWRGGLAIERIVELLAPAGTLQLRTHRRVKPPYGLAGGSEGSPSDAWMIRDGVRSTLPTKATMRLRRNDVVGHRIAGGGGFGPPSERDPALVEDDVLEGRVTLRRAKEMYGWTTS